MLDGGTANAATAPSRCCEEKLRHFFLDALLALVSLPGSADDAGEMAAWFW